MLRSFASVLIVLLLSITINVCYSASANEEVYQFNSHLIVNTDASVDVTESIAVHANMGKIKHGIFRRLPNSYIDYSGIQQNMKYKITHIDVNGVKANYHIEHDQNDIIIYIGDKNTFLKPGDYTFTIQYHVNNAVNFLNDYDEIYWNINGNNWDFNINQVQAIIDLPNAAIIARDAAYTGFKGQKGGDYQVAKLTNNRIEFVTTKALLPSQGLTVAVAWQKGIVTKPTWFQLLLYQIDDQVFVLAGILTFILFYYVRVWYVHGRDLRKKTIIPLFEPPANITPELMRYIDNMGSDDAGFNTAIINMATQGYLSVINTNNKLTLTKTNKPTAQLPKEELAIYDVLFASNETIVISKANSSKLTKAQSRFEKAINKLYRKDYFVMNKWYVALGVLMSLSAFAVPIYYSYLPIPETMVLLIILIFITGWSLACLFSFAASLYLISSAIFVKTQKMKTFLSGMLLMFVSSLFILLGYVVLKDFSSVFSPFLIACFNLICLVNIIFSRLLKAPTSLGRNVMNQIDGFRMFLTTTERYRLGQFNPPEITPILFEKYLPYAMALGVENAWYEQFNRAMLHAGNDPASYHPTWYRGSRLWTINSIREMQSSLSSSMVSVSSSSSSGSGGGGSSGGGRGGGGGGGW